MPFCQMRQLHHDVAHVVTFDLQIQLRASSGADFLLNPIKRHQRYKGNHRTDRREHIVSHADRQTETGNDPDTGRRCQSANGKSLTQDCTGTQKTDAVDDLCAQSRRVRGRCAEYRNRLLIHDAACHHDHARAECYQNMCADSRRMRGSCALRADGKPDDHCTQQPQHDIHHCNFPHFRFPPV